jgi:hypothetical protein
MLMTKKELRMTELITVNHAANFEQLIFQVRGIQAARVVTDTNGAIDEIHVVGSPGRTPKQIVRDIESILYVRGGVRLDHRKVSLVQLADTPAPRTPLRVMLRHVRQEMGALGPKITVTLGLNDRTIEGIREGTAHTESALIQTAAAATVAALDQLIGAAGELQLELSVQQELGNLPICLSHLTLSTDQRFETLLGVSVIRNDITGAAARSVLDAVNRRLHWLLGIE